MDLGLVRLLCFGLRFFAEAPECQSTANVPKQQSRRECERLCTLLSKVLMPSVGDVAKSSVVPCFNRRDPIQTAPGRCWWRPASCRPRLDKTPRARKGTHAVLNMIQKATKNDTVATTTSTVLVSCPMVKSPQTLQTLEIQEKVTKSNRTTKKKQNRWPGRYFAHSCVFGIFPDCFLLLVFSRLCVSFVCVLLFVLGTNNIKGKKTSLRRGRCVFFCCFFVVFLVRLFAPSLM